MRWFVFSSIAVLLLVIPLVFFLPLSYGIKRFLVTWRLIAASLYAVFTDDYAQGDKRWASALVSFIIGWRLKGE